MGISIDQFIELLNEIVILHRGHMNVSSFNEYVDICYPKTKPTLESNEHHTKFYINPLLRYTDTEIQLKYDILAHVVKVRHIQYSVQHNNYSINLIPLLAENYHGKGVILEELTLSLMRFKSNNVIGNITQLLEFILDEYRNVESRQLPSEVLQKAISFVIYLTFKCFNPHDKVERIELLKRIYQGNLTDIFIYGEFYPLDFSKAKIRNSTFVGYTSLLSSKFPEKETVFYYCHFQDISFKGNPHIPQTVFDSTCNIPIELRTCFVVDEEKKSKHYQGIKNDLKKFFKSFVTANTFSGKSLNRINSNYLSKMDRKIFIDESLDFRILNVDIAKGNKIFSIDTNYQPSVITLINQNNLDHILEKFCEHILAKYYLQR